MTLNWLNPFTLRRSYTTHLSLTEIEAVLREQQRYGLISTSDSKPVFRNHTFRIITYIQKCGIRVSGTVNPGSEGNRMNICYQLRYNPLFIFIPLLLIMVYPLRNGRAFLLNGAPASRTEFTLAVAGLYIVSVGITSLMLLWLLTAKREELERLLVLDRIPVV